MGKSNNAKKQKLEIVGGQEEQSKFNGKNFTPHNLVTFLPQTEPQNQFINAFFNKGKEVIVQTGSPGTGKTAMSLHSALLEVLSKETVYEKLIIIRSAVQAREIGFLKGGEEEKNESYEGPYVDLCDELMEFKSNNYNNLKAKHLVEFHNSSFLRGKTFHNAIVIFDEHQNATYHELSTAFGRLGNNSKIVFNGDQRQCDLHKRNDVSGWGQFSKVLKNMPESFVEFVYYEPDHVLRNDLVKSFLLAEEKTFSD